MKKIRVIEDGKNFEVYLKFALTEDSTLIGCAYAGSFSSARAVHAAMYSNQEFQIIDEQGNILKRVKPNGDYRRVETIDDKVTHHTLLPRSTTDEDYQKDLLEMVKNKRDIYPERVILAPKGNVTEVAGQFLAETFGLPRTHQWVVQYLNILGFDKFKKVDVLTTDLAGDWQQLKAVKLIGMKEIEILNIIEDAIKKGLLNTRSTSLMGEGTFEEDMTTEEYLRQNAEIFAKKLDATMKPLTDGSFISPFVGELTRLPVPSQAKASMASLEVLKKKKGVFMVGDMGIGKTIVALTSVYTQMRIREESGAKDGMRVLIIAPSNVVPKWANSEIYKTIKRYKYTTRIIKNSNEALRYVDEVKKGQTVPKGTIEFVLIGTDRMKLAADGWVLGANWDSQDKVWRSPNTWKPLLKPNQTKMQREEDLVAGWSDVVEKPAKPPTPMEIEEARKSGTLLPNGLPKAYIKSWKPDIRNFQEDYKGKKNRSLARPGRKEWAETNKKARWMIAQIFQRKLKNHFHMGIIDEVHQMKASDSGRGLALHKIMKSCRKLMFLTGTLTNGASTSIKSLLWRCFPNELLATGITYDTSAEQWASRYGVLEKIVTRADGDSVVGVSTNRKKDRVEVKEKPGISPKLISDFLLDKSIFVELSDLGVPLVRLEEIPKVITLDDDHYDEYKKLHTNLYNSALNFQKEIGSAAWSHFNPTTINYADQPHFGADVKYHKYNEFGQKELLGNVTAPAFPSSYYTNKEREILKDIESEIRQKRRCIVFTHYSGGYQTNERLKRIIKDRGIVCEIMNDKVSTDDRFDWLDKQAQAGTEVLIMNMKLVEVGLDLMEFPTIMFYQLNDDINVLRQASRRSWRLGQPKVCKVIYYIADKTTQMVQFQRLMSRRVAAMIVEGRIERSDALVKYADTASTGMVADLSKTLSSVELTNAWVSASEKDLDQNLELVTEEEFQSRIKEAFQRLTAKTVEISGYQPNVDVEFDFDALEKVLGNIEQPKSSMENEDIPLIETSEKEKHISKDEIEELRQIKKIKSKQENEPVPTTFEQLDLFADLA
ncbi:SNF2-related protein [Psychrobacillus sp. FSL H8-0487]|uniref:SNF2-related protein n=1 Tax=Psychrobacillus sp. FSL H8-0487 TaxID=2921391 RepID=UPI0030FCD052